MNAKRIVRAIPTLIALAADRGFTVELPSIVDADGGRSPNPKALRAHGGVCTTLVRGPVRIALSNIGLYYHDHRVWLGDPFTDQETKRVTMAAVVVEPGSRRKGEATSAVRDVLAICQEAGLWVQLEATPIADQKAKGQRAITRAGLIRWYGSLGFAPSYPGEGREILEWRPT